MTENATEESIRKRIREKRQQHQKGTQDHRQKISAAIQRACSTADGKILLHYLMVECGYQKNSVQGSKSSGEFLEQNTMYNEGRRDLYLNLRNLLKPVVLVDVEIYGVLKHLKDEKDFNDMFE